jgi:hypothetical protein
MIRDLADLEPLLRQYDPGKVLVGPLLNLADSSFRVFKIAGNGGKVYETVGLGFVKVEADAQRRRADIVAVLESRFGEVQTFDSQLEMARVAHTLWANDETSRFLATATAESKLLPARKVVQDQSLDDASKSSVLPSDRDKEFVDEAGRGSVALDAASADAQPSARDQPQPTPAAQTDEPLELPNAQARLPLNLDPAVGMHSPLTSDNIPLAVLELKSSTDTIASTATIAETDANTEGAAATDADIEMAAETGANTETAAETEANTFDARSAKPKRRSRRRRRGSAAGAGGAAPAATDANTETIAEADANTETAAETANTQPVFEHSDQIPVETQPQNQPVSSGASASGDDHALRQGGLRPNPVLTPPADVLKWSILERIGIPFIVASAVACVIGLLLSYEESLHDSVLLPPSSLASRGGALPAVKSAMVDVGSAAAADSLRPASPSEKPTESQRPPRSTLIPPNQAALNAEITLGSATQEPIPPIPPARDPLSATAAPIAVPQSAAPAPSGPAVRLDNDETTRLIERGQDFLNAGDFAAARLLFKRAADAGSAEAALALGSTYDPSVIKQLGAVSITPDIDSALKWYETAADHGSAEAADRYSNLMRAR